MTRKGPLGITSQVKAHLIQQALDRRRHGVEQADAPLPPPEHPRWGSADVPEKYSRMHLHPGYQQLRIINDGGARLGVVNPYFKVHDDVAGVTTRIAGREYLNYASYNYLGF